MCKFQVLMKRANEMIRHHTAGDMEILTFSVATQRYDTTPAAHTHFKLQRWSHVHNRHELQMCPPHTESKSPQTPHDGARYPHCSDGETEAEKP